MEKEYNNIKNSGKPPEEFINALADFERKYPEHFESKIVLASFYAAQKNIEKAKDYLLRAEAVVKKASRADEQNIATMYGLLGKIYRLENNHAQAMVYAEKAIASSKKHGPQYLFLKAQVLGAQGKTGEALALFDSLFVTMRDEMASDDIWSYAYFLAQDKRMADASMMLDLFFEKGSYFAGFGVFASSVYEAAGDYRKAIFCNFLEYDYHSGYAEADDMRFLSNIDTAEKAVSSQGKGMETRASFQLVRSCYNNSIPIPSDGMPVFAASTYAGLRSKINRRLITGEEFNELLKLEPFFSGFPTYYWSVWQAAEQLSPSGRADFVSVLQKIIALDKSGPYARIAWNTISEMMGF
ncbi:MAG: tetratricopeptide repeat protein [Treponema sp.]|nr:tetratricopeptide repeat protein [Treponema sp.]